MSQTTSPISPGRWLAIALLCAASLGAAHARDPNLGRNLAATCANCHGTNGHATGDAVKSLASLSADEIVAALQAFSAGTRPATVMQQLAKGYSDEQMRAIAAFFAAQPPGPR